MPQMTKNHKCGLFRSSCSNNWALRSIFSQVKRMTKNSTFIQSLRHAIDGFVFLLKNEKNARIHLVATFGVLIISSFLSLKNYEWLLILLAISMVWITELFNTALENLFNLVKPEKNEFVKIGKDTSAAAVLLTAVFTIIVGLLILAPALYQKILSWLSG